MLPLSTLDRAVSIFGQARFEAMREVLSGGKLFHYTTVSGWTNAGVNGGSVVVNGPNKMQLRATVATGPNSTVLSRTPAFGMNSHQASHLDIDWDKKLSFLFALAKVTSNANAVAHCQIKKAATIGVLGEYGIDLQLDNLALKGFAYGSGGLSSELDLSFALTDSRPVWIRVDLTSTGVAFYVDDVGKGSITTAGEFPTGASGGEVNILFSNDNGGTGTQTDLIVGEIFTWQEA